MRRLLFQIHLWSGLILCIPLVVLGVTGSILVCEHEWNPPPHYELAQGEPRPIAEIVAAATTKAKPGFKPSAYRAPATPREPASVTLSPGKKGRSMQVIVDPVSLAVLDTPQPGFFRTLLKLHANLLMDGRAGRQIVGAFGIILLLMSLSGLMLWWPRDGRWKAAFMARWGRRGIRGYRFNRELHGAAGAWGCSVLLIAAFTGVYLAFPEQTGAVIRTFLPARDFKKITAELRAEPTGSAISVDAVAALAQEAVPDAAITMIRFPPQPDKPYSVTMQSPKHTGGPSILVFVDPWKNAVMDVQDPRTFSAGEAVIAWQRVLHGAHGTDWLWWKVLLFLAGLLPLLFATTGITMWLLKRRRAPGKW